MDIPVDSHLVELLENFHGWKPKSRMEDEFPPITWVISTFPFPCKIFRGVWWSAPLLNGDLQRSGRKNALRNHLACTIWKEFTPKKYSVQKHMPASSKWPCDHPNGDHWTLKNIVYNPQKGHSEEPGVFTEYVLSWQSWEIRFALIHKNAPRTRNHHWNYHSSPKCM